MPNISEDLFATLQANGLTNPGECYANACKSVMQGHFELYVLGLAELPGERIPVRHAWVETGGINYDPTLQQAGLNLQTEYEARYRLSVKDILRLIREHYGIDELARMNRDGIGFNIPTLGPDCNLIIDD